MKLTWKKCPCNHPACKLWQPQEIGQFYQGTGFSAKDRKLLDVAFARVEELEVAFGVKEDMPR